MTQIADLRRALHQEMALLEPAPDLERQVLAAAFARPREQRRASARSAALRVSGRTLQLAAGVVVVAIFSSLLFLTRFGQGPATGYQLNAVERAQLAELEARPLHLPPLPAAGEACPWTTSPGSPYKGGTMGFYGSGPVLGSWVPGDTGGSFGHELLGSKGSYEENNLITDPTVVGPVLVRGQTLDGLYPIVFSGQYAAGPILFRDTARDQIPGRFGGQRNVPVVARREAVLPAGHTAQDPKLNPGWAVWPVLEGLPDGAKGCVALQVDTEAVSEVIALGTV